MNPEELRISINLASDELEKMVSDSKIYTHQSDVIVKIKKVLHLLENAVKENPDAISERVLRAMRDISVILVKMFEDTPLRRAVGEINEILYYGIPLYKTLKPLGMEFGKGEPI